MPKITYIAKKFSKGSQAVIAAANNIITEYAAQGYDLTLRQLYYQFVARAWLPNKDSEYKRLGSIVNDARLAGLIDWNAIQDRTRNLLSLSHWTDPSDIIEGAASSYHVDHWTGQTFRPEVWIEKDALLGVVDRVCTELDVSYFSCRGYTSQSEMWRAARRLYQYARSGQLPIILHLGDHDPSGIDMTRDIRDRLNLFVPVVIEVRRLALNMEQVQEYNPPPNPAKMTDSRYWSYRGEHGEDSWELDALEPQVMTELIRDAVEEMRDEDAYEQVTEREKREKALLGKAADRWDEVVELLGGEE